MIYSVIAIVKDVRKILDENEYPCELISGSDTGTLSLDAIIIQKLTDATRSVLEASSNRLLDSGINLSTEITWEKSKGIGMGSILLPDDFCRLSIFQMSDWQRPVLRVITDDNPLYALQKSRFTGIVGGPAKPVCVLTSNSVGKVIEFYSCRQGDDVSIKMAKYHPYPTIKDNMIEVCKNLYTPIVYYTAGLVAITYKDVEHGAKLMEIATDYIK